MVLSRVKMSKEDGVGTITMDYPKNLNALDVPMLDELLYVLGEYEKDDDVKVIVLTGTERAFSAGGDIGSFYKGFHSGEEPDFSEAIEKAGKVALFIRKLDKIVITSISGAAAGAGASLVLASDVAIMEEDAKLIWAFVSLGLVPDTGGCYLLTKALGVPKAFELASTGRPVSASEAKELGLITKVCKKEDLAAETKKIAFRYVQGPLKSYTNIKKQINASMYADFEDYLKVTESETVGECLKTADFREGIDAFVEKRKPVFQGR